ncbi:transcriptional regulator [Helicobacter pylori]|uniref:transcriptional regulator n=1 Tax=Helicobacter pylori TaxID=210 RepID=UPI000D3D8AD0|nr:transcriptional regulator [Helicobacter pylori]PUD43230.1 transcriptional regulator [Helicobacter pylori]WRG89856.1 transcriptional regulator [Helicobacter pylori]
MGRLIEKWFGFSQIREELEARIGELEDENTELENRNDKLFAENESLSVKISGLENTNAQLRQSLENSNAQLVQAEEKIATEKTELEREIARLKSLEATDKSELDLQNWSFKSTIEDLKRQNRKLEEENMALKERGLKEQLSKLQPQKPQ